MFTDIRVGFGTDTHRLAEGESFYIGGIKIEHLKGCVGHSDGDALLHAISDSLLGAANLRDIGFHFPDTNEDFKDADSKILLSEVMKMIKDKGFKINNIDCTVHLQKPKLKDYIPEIKKIYPNYLK